MALLPDLNTLVVTVGVVGVAVYFLFRCFTSKRHRNRAFLHGKTVIMTGANSSLGKETAKELARRGARVVLACSNEEEGREVAQQIEGQSRGEVVVRKLNLASFKDIRRFSEEIMQSERTVDILINNAEIICPKKKTKDGLDMVFGVNHLGHFLLTQRLVEKMKASAPARIINVSSCAHEHGEINWVDLNYNAPGSYDPEVAYAQSKLANILFTKELARRLRDSGVNVYAVQSDASRNIYPPTSTALPLAAAFLDYVFGFFPDLFQKRKRGIQTIIYCAMAKDLIHQTGLYYSDCKVTQPSPQAMDKESAKRLWDISLKMTGLQN